MRRYSRYIVIALVVGVGLPLVVGCPIVKLRLCVVNKTTCDLVQLYVSPVTSDSWGSDVLGGLLAADGTYCLEGITANTYDVRAVFRQPPPAEVVDEIVVVQNVKIGSMHRNVTYSGAPGLITGTIEQEYLKLEDL